MDINTGKTRLILAIVLTWILIGILFISYGSHATWGLWQIPVMDEPFSDFRLIPGTVETLKLGLDPTVENPGDPVGRQFNYPPIWYLFLYTGIEQAHTVYFGISFIVLFFAGYISVLDKIDSKDVIPLWLVLFSPAIMLLFERGNVDSVIFFLVCMILVQARKSPALANLLIMFAALLKLFPITCVIVWLRDGKKALARRSIAALTVFGIYIIATWKYFVSSWTTTQRGDDISYGVFVFSQRSAAQLKNILAPVFAAETMDQSFMVIPFFAALGLLSASVLLGFKSSHPIHEPSHKLDAFRVGAVIYITTFLLGNNWDYRLAFLLLVMPQLLDLARGSHSPLREVSRASMVVIFLSCWYLLIRSFAAKLLSPALVFTFDELVNWTLFGLLSFAITATLPPWVHDELQKIRNFLPSRSHNKPLS